MISAQSRNGRRIVGSLDRGSDLFEALRSMCSKHGVRSGEFRGMGALELAELCAYDQTHQKWKPKRNLSGGLELLTLTGNISEENGQISIVARATLMRDRDSGVELLGGRLLSARVYTVELVIESFDDLLLRRRHDVATGLDTWQEMLVGEGATLPAASPMPRSAATFATPVAASPAPAPPPPAPQARPAGRPHAPHDDLEPTIDQFEPVKASVFERLPRTQFATPAPPPAGTGTGTGAGAGTGTGTGAGAGTGTGAGAGTGTGTGTGTGAGLLAGSPVGTGFQRAPAAPSDFDEDIQLAAGDVIVHPKFRRCVVERVEGNNEFVQVRLRNGRVVRLSLDVIHLTPQGTENGQRVFAVSIG